MSSKANPVTTLRWVFFLALAFAAFTAAPVLAQDSDPLDWSVQEQKMWDWPLQELSFEVNRKGNRVQHTFLVQETPDEVIDLLRTLESNATPLGDNYTVSGMSYQQQTSTYSISIHRQGLFHLLTVAPYQGGSKLLLDATPHPLPVRNVLKPLYPYRLGDGHKAPCHRHDGQDA